MLSKLSDRIRICDFDIIEVQLEGDSYFLETPLPGISVSFRHKAVNVLGVPYCFFISEGIFHHIEVTSQGLMHSLERPEFLKVGNLDQSQALQWDLEFRAEIEHALRRYSEFTKYMMAKGLKGARTVELVGIVRITQLVEKMSDPLDRMEMPAGIWGIDSFVDYEVTIDWQVGDPYNESLIAQQLRDELTHATAVVSKDEFNISVVDLHYEAVGFEDAWKVVVQPTGFGVLDRWGRHVAHSKDEGMAQRAVDLDQLLVSMLEVFPGFHPTFKERPHHDVDGKDLVEWLNGHFGAKPDLLVSDNAWKVVELPDGFSVFNRHGHHVADMRDPSMAQRAADLDQLFVSMLEIFPGFLPSFRESNYHPVDGHDLVRWLDYHFALKPNLLIKV
ncbi:MAG: hypothetical protein EOP04_02850 [Proteobacteria bacterium]|nr:MAG: hypothetical protein EOP04_02850 [Pseudomonadota bacterium]